ncbi:unnamed protein product [Auanema sp. JU1783]|nr:unnamed protein product [Auanema sp. JU1783]
MLISICVILCFLILIDVLTKQITYTEPKPLEQPLATYKPDSYTRVVRDNVQYYISERWIPSVHAKFTLLPIERLALCQSETSATTTLLNFFCFSQLFHSHKNESLHESFNNDCIGKSEMLATADIFLKIPGGVNILFLIEEPFRRFAQAFRRLCLENIQQHPQICFGCGSDIACVINKLPSALKKWNDGTESNSIYSLEKVYFSPQSWNCGLMNTYEMTTFIRLQDKTEEHAIPSQVESILLGSGVNSSLIDEFNNLVNYSSGKISPIERNISYILYSAKDLKNKLKHIYRDDFELFHSTV